MKESIRLNNYDKNIKTYDFKTLYTKIPHNKLKETLKHLFLCYLNTKKENTSILVAKVLIFR